MDFALGAALGFVAGVIFSGLAAILVYIYGRVGQLPSPSSPLATPKPKKADKPLKRRPVAITDAMAHKLELEEQGRNRL